MALNNKKNKTKVDVFVVATLMSLVIWFALRLFLLFYTGLQNVGYSALPQILVRGLWFDICVLVFALGPLLVVRYMVPKINLPKPMIMFAQWSWFWLFLFSLVFISFSEVIFWQEFSTRLNFIAVDYLIYTQEVIANIVESYPMPALISIIFMISSLSVFFLNYFFEFTEINLSKKTRATRSVLALSLLVILPYVADLNQFEISSNAYANEISSNGLFSFFAAYRRNDIEYDKFYKSIPQVEADKILGILGVERQPFAKFISGDPIKLVDIHEPGELGPFFKQPKNIVLITVESLSAKYLGVFNNNDRATPQLDRLAREGLLFTQLYATGTRTVRGLESLSLGIPPVPGQAIVRRPHSDHLSTIGEVLKNQKFSTYFVYGGYGYFDNMDSYFLSNDYQIFDRANFKLNSANFVNAWGVSDETLYENTLSIIDQAPQKTPFFVHIMTTSNHRPYTYPDGRIDILSPGGRAGAVKYTDYAIGQFIEQAKAKPWFDDTLFVIVADHCASIAGRTRLPIQDYHIPLIFYGPKLLGPGRYERVASQIDVAPTLLDVLGVDGDEYFFGQSLFEHASEPGRAFISNYQSLGYYKSDTLTVLGPKKTLSAYHVDQSNYDLSPTPINQALANEAISYYQTADRSIRSGALKFADKALSR